MNVKSSADLSLGEDLSIAVMNLISIEEHLYFSFSKTGDPKYMNVLSSVREIRKQCLAELVKNPQGEEWCISKHLLASSMRLVEVGNKHLSEGRHDDAECMFRRAFDLYSLFWGLSLGMRSPVDFDRFKSSLASYKPQTLQPFPSPTV